MKRKFKNTKINEMEVEIDVLKNHLEKLKLLIDSGKMSRELSNYNLLT